MVARIHRIPLTDIYRVYIIIIITIMVLNNTRAV